MAVEPRRQDVIRAAAAQLEVGAALDDAESELALGSWLVAAALRPQAGARTAASRRPRSTPAGGHSSTWKTRLHGKKSIAALVALADESTFLDPPAAEIPSDAAPDLDTQRQIISRTVKYLKEVIPKLPDFFAIRTTIEYEQPSLQKADTWKTALADQSLREAVIEKATLRYRNGHEEQGTEKREARPSARKRDLNLVGVFSPCWLRAQRRYARR